MRYIDLAFTSRPEAFDERAAAALADGPARIDDHSSVWRDCKDHLKAASYQKCFYCESKDLRSDGAVDHFRPKSVYPWSAFTFSNFRFACTFCNSLRKDKETGKTGGKGNQFPLFEEAPRATCCAEECCEQPKLIDPCRAGDPLEIDFSSDGRAVPAYADEGDKRFERGKVSINAYHLNHTAFVEERRKHAIILEEKINAACVAHESYAAGNLDARTRLDDAISDLHRAIQPQATYSVFARRVLNLHRENPLIEAVLTTA